MSSQDEPRPVEPTLGPTPPTPAPAASRRPASAALASVDSRVIGDFARLYLQDRRSERRSAAVPSPGLAAGVRALAWGFFGQRQRHVAPSSRSTASSRCAGIWSDSEANAEALNAALRDAFEDNGAQAVVLRINSPGGIRCRPLMSDEILRLKASARRRCTRSARTAAAYYIAAGADEIFVDKASIVGSIGVLIDGFGFTGTMDKLGVERRLITAGSHKGMLDPFSPQSETDKAYAQSLIAIHAAVVKQRGARAGDARDLSGLFLEWRGRDRIGAGRPIRQPRLRGARGKAEVIDYTPRRTSPSAGQRFGAAGAGAVRAIGGVGSIRSGR